MMGLLKTKQNLFLIQKWMLVLVLLVSTVHSPYQAKADFKKAAINMVAAGLAGAAVGVCLYAVTAPSLKTQSNDMRNVSQFTMNNPPTPPAAPAQVLLHTSVPDRAVAQAAPAALPDSTINMTINMNCLNDREREAFRIYALQAQLLVAASKTVCRLQETYNAFVRKFQTQLTSERKVMGNFLNKGTGSLSREDAYITDLVNLVQQHSTRNKSDAQFCKQTADLAASLNAIQTVDQLRAFARNNPQPLVPMCN